MWKVYYFERGEVYTRGMNSRELKAQEREYGKLLRVEKLKE